MREFAIFLTGFGLGILTLVIKNTYKISITTEENYYLKNLGVFMAVITAISATFISIWQGFENRQAHRKGVLPYLNINRDSFTYVSRPVISISNTGVGPARD